VRLIVVDPRLLVRAFEFPRCNVAKLLALFAYGRICVNAQGYRREEVEKMEESARECDADFDISRERAAAEREIEQARCRKDSMESAFEQHAPGDLLLVTSPPIVSDLLDLAQASQTHNPHVYPDRVVRHVASHTFRALEELGPAPNYLSRGQVSKHDYLIHTAMEAEASTLVTDDPMLLLPGDASHESPKTRHRVRPYSLEEFIADLPVVLDLNAIDPYAVLRAAVAEPAL
jgi:hypothetical protein